MGEGATVLNGSGVTQEAFRGAATDVTIRGIVVEAYAPSTAPNAAINPDPGNGAARWLIEDVEARFNFPGAGIKLADQSTVRRSRIHHNGKVGITAWRVSGAVVEDSEIAHNNWDPADPASTTGLSDYLWDAGGAKFVSTTDLVLRGNDVHHNVGTGLWCDIDCRNTVIEGNHVHDNAAAGVFYEISYGGIIRYNDVRDNGLTGTRHGPGVYGAGILLSESRDVEVHGNVVVGNQAGVVGKQASTVGRGEAPYGPYVLDNLHVHDNDIASSDRTSGVVQYVGDHSFFTSRNIRFERNTYRGPVSHLWNEQNLGPASWQAAGLDLDGRWL
jgi:parallel beta-helix repeat protein